MFVALTRERVPVQLDKVAENVFGEALLLRQALQQQHHLHLAHSVHPLCRHAPALPVNICPTMRANTQGYNKTKHKRGFLLHENTCNVLLLIPRWLGNAFKEQ